MTNNYQKFKYRLIVPFLISLVKLFKKEKHDLTVQPFYILGSGRNGSTLLASIINSNQNIVIPPEQYVVPYAIMSWYLRFWTYSSFVNYFVSSFLKKNQTSNWSINELKSKERLLQLKSKNISYVIDSFFREYSEQSVEMWGDKTPLNTHFVEYIYDVYPNAKYIVLVRDPRDVVLSYSKMPEHPASNPNYAVWKWNDSIRAYDYLKNKHAALLLVKYEDLVSETDKELARISRFLGFQITKEKNHDALGVFGQKHHENLSKPISTNSVGKWQKELPEEIVKYITLKLKKNMGRFNY